MLLVDLERLDQRLSAPQHARQLQALVETLAEQRGHYDWERLRRLPWQALVIRTRVASRLHPDTRRRLNAGDPADRSNFEEGITPSALGTNSCTLEEALKRIRTQMLSLDPKLRLDGCRAPAGHTRKVAVFPAADRIPAALQVVERFREHAPLRHAVWNAALSYLLLLRVHPFPDGNGRTMRALLSCDLWAAGLTSDSFLPMKRVLDANRANEARVVTAVSRSQRDSDRCVDEIARALSFVVEVVRISAQWAHVPAEG